MKKKAKGIVLALLIDGSRGIYIPKKFAENYIGWSGVETEDRETLLAGPDHRDYWEAWDSVLSFFYLAALAVDFELIEAELIE